MANPHKGHRERVRQEFIRTGGKSMPDHKVLETLLFYAIPRADTNEIAHRLIDRFGGVSGVLDAPLELLQEVQGVGESTALLLKVACETMCRYLDGQTHSGGRIRNTEEAKEFMRYKFVFQTVECIIMACIGAKGRVIFCSKIAEGSPETVGIRPREIIRLALQAEAVKVVLAHNHPHGICNPSMGDREATGLIYDELMRLNIELLDHIIVAPDGVSSMREQQMIPPKGPTR